MYSRDAANFLRLRNINPSDFVRVLNIPGFGVLLTHRS
jgi:hypothetical protein